MNTEINVKYTAGDDSVELIQLPLMGSDPDSIESNIETFDAWGEDSNPGTSVRVNIRRGKRRRLFNTRLDVWCNAMVSLAILVIIFAGLLFASIVPQFYTQSETNSTITNTTSLAEENFSEMAL